MHVLQRFSCLLLSAGALVAQAPAPITATAPTSATGLWREGSLLCGGGPTYRVEFDETGCRYVPALANASTVRPIHIRLARLQRGARLLAGDRPVTPRRTGTVVEYPHADGIVERYALSTTGVKQSLALAGRPAGRGDVVVHLRIATRLAADRAGDVSGGVRWTDGADGGVAFGRAMAIDARGATAPMTMSLHGDRLTLRLAESFVDSATYPLVLDPPISTEQQLSTGGGVRPASAYDATNDRYLVVWSRRLSQDSEEIYGQLVDTSGAALGSILPIATGALTVRNRPAVCWLPEDNRFCVAWQSAPTVLGPWDTEIASADATGAVSSAILMTNSYQPVLGATTDKAVLIVTSTLARTLLGRVFVLNGGAPNLVGSEFPLGTGFDSDQPAISRFGDAQNQFLVTWRDGGTDIRGRMLAASPPFGVSTSIVTIDSGLQARRRPTVDGDGRDFLVAFEREESAGSAVHDVMCRGVQWDGTTLTASTPVLPIDADPGQDEITPALARIGSVYVTAWSNQGAGFLDYDLQARTFGLNGQPCGQQHVARSSTSDHDAHPAIATQRAAGGVEDGALIAFAGMDNRSFATDVRSWAFEAFGGGSFQTAGAGCGNGGAITPVGDFAIGNLDFRMDLVGADPAATVGLLVIGLPGAATIPCSGCTLTTPLVYVSMPIANGAASFPLPQPCELAPIQGIPLEFQWIVVGTTVSPCPIAPRLSATDRIVGALEY